MIKKLWIAMIAFVLLGSAQTFGIVYFLETFSTDSPNMAAMNSTDYPDYTTRAAPVVVPPGTANVASGELSLDASSSNNETMSLITESLGVSTATPFTLSVDLDSNGSEGLYFIGLVAGNRAIGYWPGWSVTTLNHARYVYDPTTGQVHSGIAFSGPAAGGPITGTNHLEIAWDGVGNWTYEFTKVNGGGASYTTTFADPTFVMGQVGVFARNFQQANPFADFDNLEFLAIPEPSTVVLLALGGGLLWRRLKK